MRRPAASAAATRPRARDLAPPGAGALHPARLPGLLAGLAARWRRRTPGAGTGHRAGHGRSAPGNNPGAAMSGPKVVRIVTREEILAICEGHLRRLQRAFERWQRLAAAVGELDEATLAATRARHARLRQLLQEDRLTELQKDVPLE